MTLTELARRVEVSIAYLSRIERERENSPPDRLMEALARALRATRSRAFFPSRRGARCSSITDFMPASVSPVMVMLSPASPQPTKPLLASTRTSSERLLVISPAKEWRGLRNGSAMPIASMLLIAVGMVIAGRRGGWG